MTQGGLAIKRGAIFLLEWQKRFGTEEACADSLKTPMGQLALWHYESSRSLSEG